MPYVIPHYLPPLPLKEGHLGTVLPYLFRKPPKIDFDRYELATPDNDFLHLDQCKKGNTRCVLIVHGLEGSAQSTYILSLAKHLLENKWDIAALNLRGCSGIANVHYKSYNSGNTDDLETAIQYIEGQYEQIAIVGFSLGGNIVLKYTGEKSININKKIVASIGISVPCHLSDASSKMEDIWNRLYTYRFVYSLKKKLRIKMRDFPEKLELKRYKAIRTIRHLDDAYTAPANGYKDSEDYYTRCSSVFVIAKVAIPTLLINAQDDPFLSESCFPRQIAEENALFHLYVPKYGGHVGFWPEEAYSIWKHEEWILDFLNKLD